MKILLRWLFNALVVLLASFVLSGITVANFYSALIVVLFLGIVNAVIRPIIILLTLPINILTLGLFTLVINSLLVLLVASVVKGFSVAGFLPALSLSLFLWLGSMISNLLFKEKTSNEL
ncbi:MAG: phage holin family protein [Candidatus Falkowbacteria bacterium]|nr:phage holin family protein [Candidatus Falkowbacteria bacterium]